MTLLILCVMLCIVGPLPKVSALSSSDLEGKVANLESKLEDMSTVITRLVKENAHLETIVDTVMKAKGKLESRVNLLEQMVRQGMVLDHEGADTTGETAKMGKVKNQGSGIMRLTDDFGMKDEEEESKAPYHGIQENRKRIEPTAASTIGVVAFHAYLSKENLGHLPSHSILKFDSASLNRGNGFNAHNGIFVAPTSGTYVFTWSIMAEGHGNMLSQLMKNSDIVGTRAVDSSYSSEWHFSTGIVVADINQGDRVYVRLENVVGNVLSIIYSRTTFSGWLLSEYKYE